MRMPMPAMMLVAATMATPSKRTATAYRSGLEAKNAAHLTKLGLDVKFEPYFLRYLTPAEWHKYTPDFVLPNGIIIETKGIFDSDDRKKHRLLKAQYPDLDVRFVFTNPNAKLRKGSPTSYAKWCTGEGFKHAKGLVPIEWIVEPHSQLRAAAIALARSDVHLQSKEED